MEHIWPPLFSVPRNLDNSAWSAMRVGTLCHPTCGGSGRVACDLANAYANMGAYSDFLGDETPFFVQERASGTSDGGHAAKSRNDLRWHWPEQELQRIAQSVADQVQRCGHNVLHYHYAAPYAHIAKIVRRILKGKAPLIVGTLHGTDVTRFENLHPDKENLARALEAADVLTTVSHSHSRLAQSVFALDELPIVIPNPVDLEKFYPHPHPKSPGRPPVRPRMVHVSNFRSVKNPMGVAEVFIRVRRQLDIELCLVGEGKELPVLLRELDRAGVGDDVVTLGAISDVENVIRASDILLMTSTEESFGLALLEAMACGIPVLSTNVGGVTEVVQHGRNGFLFDSGDWDTAARFAIEILGESKVAERMRNAGPEDAKQYAVAAIATRYLELYTDWLDARRPALAAVYR